MKNFKQATLIALIGSTILIVIQLVNLINIFIIGLEWKIFGISSFVFSILGLMGYFSIMVFFISLYKQQKLNFMKNIEYIFEI